MHVAFSEVCDRKAQLIVVVPALCKFGWKFSESLSRFLYRLSLRFRTNRSHWQVVYFVTAWCARHHHQERQQQQQQQ